MVNNVFPHPPRLKGVAGDSEDSNRWGLIVEDVEQVGIPIVSLRPSLHIHGYI